MNSKSLARGLQASIACITSSEPERNKRFGSAFAIRASGSTTYLVTCWHVVEDVGGHDRVLADGIPAKVVASGAERGLDLVVLRVEDLPRKESLKLRSPSGYSGESILTAGFHLPDGKQHMFRSLRGCLKERVGFHHRDRVRAWDLEIESDATLEPGYSGSPVVSADNGEVVAIVSHRQGQGRSGFAIGIEELQKIWRAIDSQQLYKNLLKLGYRQQSRLFRKVVEKHKVAAFLIHGSVEYGQRWLLNRLVVQYLPEWIRGKTIKVDVSRRVRGSSVRALWRDLAGRVGLRGPRFELEEVCDRVFQAWQTQDVLLVLYEVNFMPEPEFHRLLDDFWLPLAERAKSSISTNANHPYRLLMFLVDYDGRVGEWEAPFVEKLDAAWKPDQPIKTPKIQEFSDEELEMWIENEYKDLPAELTAEIDAAVAAILEQSEAGVPELVLREICDRCGFNWYDEAEKWMKL